MDDSGRKVGEWMDDNKGELNVKGGLEWMGGD